MALLEAQLERMARERSQALLLAAALHPRGVGPGDAALFARPQASAAEEEEAEEVEEGWLGATLSGVQEERSGERWAAMEAAATSAAAAPGSPGLGRVVGPQAFEPFKPSVREEREQDSSSWGSTTGGCGARVM